MKKVLILNTSFDRGGAAEVASKIFEIKSGEIIFFFAYGRKSKKLHTNTFYFGNFFEKYIHFFLVRFFGIEGYGSYFSTRKLIKYIKHEKFDAINIHNLHGYYLNIFTFLDFLQEENIPIIYSLHDEWPYTWLPAHSMGCLHCLTGEGKCTNTYNYPYTFVKTFAKFMIAKKSKFFLNLENITFISSTQWMIDNIKNSFLKTCKVITIPHGIDVEIFNNITPKNLLRSKYNISTEKKVVSFMASDLNDSNKGVKDILAAAEILDRNDFLFLGIGKKIKTKLTNITFTGYIENKEAIAEFLSLSDVFCSASTAESFLLSAAEAMSCGTPVVAYELPSIKNLVTPDVGILTLHQPNSLSKSILEIFKNRDNYELMKKSARHKIINNYSGDNFSDKYLKIFEEILK